MQYLFCQGVKGFLLLFVIIAVFVWINLTSIEIILFLKIEVNVKVYFTYKIVNKISKQRNLFKKLCKRVINMINKTREMRRLRSEVAVEGLRGIQTPSFALIINHYLH
jgi:hypothetical protein